LTWRHLCGAIRSLTACSRNVKDQTHLQWKRSSCKENTENPEAYNFYLKGRFFWANGLTKVTTAQSLTTRKPSNSTLICISIFWSSRLLHVRTTRMTSVEETPIATDTSRKRCRLTAPSVKPWQLWLHSISMDYDWEKGKKRWRRQSASILIIRLPIYTTEILSFFTVTTLKRFKWSQDGTWPWSLSSSVNWALGNRYFLSNKPDLAVKQFQKTLVLDPNYGPPPLG